MWSCHMARTQIHSSEEGPPTVKQDSLIHILTDYFFLFGTFHVKASEHFRICTVRCLHQPILLRYLSSMPLALGIYQDVMNFLSRLNLNFCLIVINSAVKVNNYSEYLSPSQRERSLFMKSFVV